MKSKLQENIWKYCQENSDAILASGVNTLLQLDKRSLYDTLPTYQGNYLISYLDVPYYIGEAKNVEKRIKQQRKNNTSTFYKNYLEKNKEKNNEDLIDIHEFDIQVIKTNIGRKEFEEFCIVNLHSTLNKFQLDKRTIFDGQILEELWNPIQEDHVDILEQADECLSGQQLFKWYDAQINSGPGVYYVKHKRDGLIYIGESSSIRERYRTHSGDTRFSAFRRHIGTDILGFKLKTKKELNLSTNANKDKRMHLAQAEDKKIDEYLKECIIKTQAVSFGRYEFEEYLIEKYKPFLNRKGIP